MNRHANKRKGRDGKETRWIFLPDLGRGEGCMGLDNVMATSCLQGDGPQLQYDLTTEEGELLIAIGILPTQDICFD